MSCSNEITSFGSEECPPPLNTNGKRLTLQIDFDTRRILDEHGNLYGIIGEINHNEIVVLRSNGAAATIKMNTNYLKLHFGLEPVEHLN